MPRFTFDEIKEILNKMIADDIEPELSLFMYSKEYMIIGFKDRCSFQRCGFNDGSGEFFYDTLDDLYNATTIDDIILKRDWSDITEFRCGDYEWHYGKEF